MVEAYSIAQFELNGQAVAPAPPAQAGDPPGWLRTGIPPGRAVLLGRLESEASAWVRASGFGE